MITYEPRRLKGGGGGVGVRLSGAHGSLVGPPSR